MNLTNSATDPKGNFNLKLPITVLLAAKNEAKNLPRCLAALSPAVRVVVLDSFSTDGTPRIAEQCGAEVVQFEYRGAYPKKRQWALDHLPLTTPWILLLDADEVVPDELWLEISTTIRSGNSADAYFITKGFHFLGRRFRFGGFSHAAILLFKVGRARFEKIAVDDFVELDMEIHERLLVDGQIGRLKTALIHEDFKGLEAYITKHNKYSTWEAKVRHRYLTTGVYGEEAITARLFGNTQERRRFLKRLVMRIPFEHHLWFFYHFVLRLGFLEGKAELIASQIRSAYISQTNAKIYELELRQN